MTSADLEKKMQAKLKELAKKPSNKKCFDCGMSGPHANVVLAPYNVFVCQLCAGLHRSFAHKVKGISMASFSKDEVAALEDGGNKKAASVWLAKLDIEKTPFPKQGDEKAIKERMSKTYEKKEWYSETPIKKKKPKSSVTDKTAGTPSKSIDKPPADKVKKQDSEEVEEEDGDEEEETKKPEKKKEPVKGTPAPLVDLLDFSAAPKPAAAPAPAEEEGSEGNPFDVDDEEESEAPALIPSIDIVKDSPVVSVPASTAGATGSPQERMLQLVQSLLKSGMTPESVANLCNEAIKKALNPGASPAVSAPVASPALGSALPGIAPVSAGPASSGSAAPPKSGKPKRVLDEDLFAAAEKAATEGLSSLGTSSAGGFGSGDPFGSPSSGDDGNPFGSPMGSPSAPAGAPGPAATPATAWGAPPAPAWGAPPSAGAPPTAQPGYPYYPGMIPGMTPGYPGMMPGMPYYDPRMAPPGARPGAPAPGAPGAARPPTAPGGFPF